MGVFLQRTSQLLVKSLSMHPQVFYCLVGLITHELLSSRLSSASLYLEEAEIGEFFKGQVILLAKLAELLAGMNASCRYCRHTHSVTQKKNNVLGRVEIKLAIQRTL